MFGISDHDLMFSQEAHNSEDESGEAGHDYINTRVSNYQAMASVFVVIMIIQHQRISQNV
jgi:hypothetical protein